MEEFDFEENVVVQEAPVIQEAVLMQNENYIVDNIASLAVGDRDKSPTAGWNLYLAARDGQVSSLIKILDKEDVENCGVIVNKSYTDGEQNCTPLIIAAERGGGRRAEVEVDQGHKVVEGVGLHVLDPRGAQPQSG